MVIWGAECRRVLYSSRVVALLGLYSLFSLVIFLAAAMLRAFVLQATQSGMVLPSQDIPLAVMVVFYLSLFFLPLYVALMGFDQVSGEVGPRSIRYLTVRARRTSVVLGKFLAQTTILLGMVLVLDVGLCIYTGLTTPGMGPGNLVVHLLKFWLASTVFSLTFLALTSLCSNLTTSPAVSLISNLSVLMLSLLFWMTTMAEESNPLRLLRFLSPFAYSINLLSPEPAQVGVSVAAYMGFTVVFLVSALQALRARDL